jgi:hypothetical protein
MSETPRGIDPRGPRFVATITAVLLLVTTYLAFISTSAQAPSHTFGERSLDPANLLLVVIAALFLWSVLSPATAPWSLLYRRVVQPRLQPPTALEDPRPPRFAQGVGLAVTVIGVLLHLAGVPWALPIVAAAAFLAAFLNAAFGLCLGCQLYLLLQRAGLVGRGAPSA